MLVMETMASRLSFCLEGSIPQVQLGTPMYIFIIIIIIIILDRVSHNPDWPPSCASSASIS